MLTAVGALGAIGACATIAKPYLVPSSGATAPRASDEASAGPRERPWRVSRRRHRNARAARYAAAAAAYEDFEAAVGRRVARAFAPYPDAAPWRDSSAGRSARVAAVSATDEVWSARLASAASLLGVSEREASLRIPNAATDDPDAMTNATVAKYDNVKAWSFSRYEPSWTGAYRTYGPPVGGAQLSYFSVFKAANNNIRHSVAAMSEQEEDALNGTESSSASSAIAAFAASLSRSRGRASGGARMNPPRRRMRTAASLRFCATLLRGSSARTPSSSIASPPSSRRTSRARARRGTG